MEKSNYTRRFKVRRVSAARAAVAGVLMSAVTVGGIGSVGPAGAAVKPPKAVAQVNHQTADPIGVLAAALLGVYCVFINPGCPVTIVK